VVAILLKAGADPTWSTSARRLPLLADAFRRYEALCWRLVEAGAGLNQWDKAGETALHHAVRPESLDSVRELVALGANVDAQNEIGTTPVLEAISPIREQCVPLLYALLKAKPDLSLRETNSHRTALEHAIALGLDEAADLLRVAGVTEPSQSRHED